jgi:6,7-dimethyl-8-ribityllumazine synthase|tara:strand:+ start:67 stop:480 length:414 start_codon:yes stop_codon:yes gene_type:complete
MKKVLIVCANYYQGISANLLKEAKKTLANAKIKSSSITVPGVFEIPVTISKNIKKFDAFLSLGCVIKGETPHFELICRSTFDGLMKLSIESKKPIGNGIITALNLRQALVRSEGIKKNKGVEAAIAVIHILKNDSTT